MGDRSYLDPNDLETAGRVIFRARTLLDACGMMPEPVREPLDRLAEMIVCEMSRGKLDEDELVQTVVAQYLAESH